MAEAKDSERAKGIYTNYIQIYMTTEMRKVADHICVEMGISFTEYARRGIAEQNKRYKRLLLGVLKHSA